MIDEPPQAEAPKPTSRRRAGLGCLLELVETLVLTLVIFFVVQNFVAQPFQVKGDSMEHSFEPDDYVLVDKLSPHWDAYSRGDVVVLHPPEGWATEKTPFIKRVIGVAGDTIQVKDGRVYVNGTALDESYLFADANGTRQPTTSDEAQWVVPANDIFVMGDHRQESADSRLFGPIPV
ncbi:MAG: signal peptidase, partial [Chloroflexota bacterium]|nr:signal peptidase [Chloroflexota bacterium]